MTQNDIRNLKVKKSFTRNIKPLPFLPKMTKKDKTHKIWGVLDFETLEVNGVQQPYAWAYKIGKKFRYYVVNSDPYDKILNCFKYLSKDF